MPRRRCAPRVLFGAVAGLMVTAWPAPALAATLSGALRDAGGRAVPQLVLVLVGPSGSRTLVTGLDGRYRAEALSPGRYRLRSATADVRLDPEPEVTVAESDVRLDLTLGAAPVREHVVVTAARGEAVSSTLGVATDALEADEIARREPVDLLHLVQLLPGTTVARTGALGAQGSLFLRGGNSNAARILVDGIPVNEPGGAVNLGTQLPFELERIEIVRGAASSLYGTDALAGVVQLLTRRAASDRGQELRGEAEGGRFDWRKLAGGVSGRRARWDWNAGLAHLRTDNQEPNSALRETVGAASLGLDLGRRATLRLVLRGEDSTTGTPGQTAFGRPDLDASYERQAWVTGAEMRRAGEHLTHEVRAGFAQTRQLSLDPLDSGSFLPRSGDRVGAFPVSDFAGPGYQNDVDRWSFGYKAEAQAGPRHLLTAGLDLEREAGRIGTQGDEPLAPHRTNLGLYVQDRVLLGTSVFLTLGGRLEHNESFGTRVVPRGSVAWRIRGGDQSTTLRASAGTGIKEPSFLESFGVSFFAQGNPDLKPERSRTVDLGFEQRLLGDRLRLQATGYTHVYLDQVAYRVVDFTTFQGTFVNLGKSRARGLELLAEASPVPHLQLSAQYTFLDGRIEVSTSDFDPVLAPGRPLLRRPRHQGALSIHGERGRVRLGADLVRVGRRADSDFLGLGLTENAGYTRLDARAQARLFARWEAFAAAENLLDRRYQEALGYPALGRAVRIGLRFRSAGTRP